MFALIENGSIVRWHTDAMQPPLTIQDADGLEMPNPEPQKDFRPLVIQWPEHNKATHQAGDPTDTVEADRVLRTWVVAPRTMPPATADDVRAECQRRMMLLLGARDADHLDRIISNGQREANRLNTIRTGIPGVVAAREWTQPETVRAATLWGADAAIEALRNVSNVLEISLPADYAADSHWPTS